MECCLLWSKSCRRTSRIVSSFQFSVYCQQSPFSTVQSLPELKYKFVPSCYPFHKLASTWYRGWIEALPYTFSSSFYKQTIRDRNNWDRNILDRFWVSSNKVWKVVVRTSLELKWVKGCVKWELWGMRQGQIGLIKIEELISSNLLQNIIRQGRFEYDFGF